MDALTQAALIGTSRAGDIPITADDTVIGLVANIADLSPERRLLLQAGATAVYQAAGMVAAQGAPLPAPAPDEIRTSCSQAASELLRILLSGEHTDLLPEALGRLQQADQILPPELLPLALGQRDKALRPVLAQVVGERGRWLAQFNPAWSWVTTPLAAGDALPADATTIWEEGRLEQRLEILRWLRRHDPDMTRAWLAAVWQQERADARVELLQTFTTQLTAADIPWLESIVADRSERVRLVAVQLLAMIPASAVAQRLRQRAAVMVRYAPDPASLTVQPPQSLDDDTEQAWRQDGLKTTPPARSGGKRAFWLTEAMGHVSPACWEEQWHLTPPELVALAAQTDYAQALIEGWSAATAMFQQPQWALPLFTWWLQHPQANGFFPVYHYCAILLPLLTQSEQEALASSFFAAPDPASTSIWQIVLREMRRPWSTFFSHAYLAALRNFLTNYPAATASEVSSAWVHSLEYAATGLAVAAFTAAREPYGTAAAADAQLPHLRDFLERFTESIVMRQRLAAAIIITEKTPHE